MQSQDNGGTPGSDILRLNFPWLVIGKLKAECRWWKSGLPIHYFSNNRPLLSLHKFLFKQKLYKEWFLSTSILVLNILKSSLIRYPVSHPHPGSPACRALAGIKKPFESLHFVNEDRLSYQTKATVLKVPIFRPFRRLLITINSRLPWNFNYTCFILRMINKSPTGTCTSIISASRCDGAKCQQGKKEYFRARIKTSAFRKWVWGFLKTDQFPNSTSNLVGCFLLPRLPL